MPQPTRTQSATAFADLGVSHKLTAILAQLNITTPTPIQAQAIPIITSGRDVIGIAQTGTGKTLAFSLPMIAAIARTKKTGLIVAPTRELAEQINETLRSVGRSIGLRTALVIGGASMGRQVSDIRRRPHVIVGTPGRINDHLQQGTLKLASTGILVLDEADRMLDMGFAPQIKQILTHVPRQRQTLLFSATMPVEIEKLAARHMQTPVRVQIAQAGTVADRVDQALFVVQRDQKNRLLDKLLAEHTGTVLVFSRTKHGAKKICRAVRQMNHAAAEIHSNLSSAQRRRALEGFKSGTYRVMVATDIAARGIDVADIELVINYDLPDQLEDYVHRVGRTGRAGKKGKAISFVNPDQRHHIYGLERLVRQKLPILPLPADLPTAQAASYASEPLSYGRRQSRHASRARRPLPRRSRSSRRVRILV